MSLPPPPPPPEPTNAWPSDAEQILALLFDHPDLAAFVSPPSFDTLASLVNDKPRCLQQVQQDLVSRKFATIEDFEHAVRLVFIHAINRFYLPAPEQDTPPAAGKAVLTNALTGLDYFNHLAFQRFPARPHMDVAVLQTCRTALQAIVERGDRDFVALYTRSPFKYPVEIPGYDQHIVEPIWLGEVVRKLELLAYPTPISFSRDVHLIFQNIIDYGTTVYYEPIKPTELDDDAYHEWYIGQAFDLCAGFDEVLALENCPPLLHDGKTASQRLHEATPEPPGRRSKAMSGELTPKIHTVLKEAIDAVSRHKFAEIFRKPVDGKVLPDYYDIIKEPMDFKTLKDQLSSRHAHALTTFDRFEEASLLIFSNCRKYNPRTPQNQFVHDCCDQTEAAWKKKLEECRLIFLQEQIAASGAEVISPAIAPATRALVSPSGKSKRKGGASSSTVAKFKMTEFAHMPLTPSAQECLLGAIDQFARDKDPNQTFMRPVDLKTEINYDKIINQPMDLGTISSKLKGNEYATVQQVLDDVALVWNNCRTYTNGLKPWVDIVRDNEKFLDKAMATRFSALVEPAAVTISTEPISHPPLQQRASEFGALPVDAGIKRAVSEAIKLFEATQDKQRDFMKPVTVPGYADVITTPMDLGTVAEKLADSRYETVEQVLADVLLVWDNCIKFNGPDSDWAEGARRSCGWLDSELCKRLSRVTEGPVLELSRSRSGKTRGAAPEGLSRELLDLIVDAKVKKALIDALTTDFYDLDYAGSIFFSSVLLIPDYTDIIDRPMDMNMILASLKSGAYITVEDLYVDCKLMFENCHQYNTDPDIIARAIKLEADLDTILALKLASAVGAVKNLPLPKLPEQSKPTEGMLAHPVTGPFRRAAFESIKTFKGFDKDGIFLYPVDTDQFPTYLQRIKQLMDFSTIEKKLSNKAYVTLGDFYADVNLVWSNCRTFNAPAAFAYTEANRLEQLFDTALKKNIRKAETEPAATAKRPSSAAASSGRGAAGSMGDTVAKIAQADLARGRLLFRDDENCFVMPKKMRTADLLSEGDALLRELVADFSKVLLARHRFGVPVTDWLPDPANKADYLSKVSRPMDLETAMNKLLRGEYRGDPKLLSADILLMLHNPALYVPDDFALMRACEHLEEYWLDLLYEHTSLDLGERAARRLKREQVVHLLPVEPKTTWHPLKALTSLNVQRETTAPFMIPVYSDAITLPDYHMIVKEPSDYGTVATKTKENAYKTYGEFAHAMRLVTSNCLLYNDRAYSPILCAQADRASELFETEWARQVLSLYEQSQRKEMEEAVRRHELGLPAETPQERHERIWHQANEREERRKSGHSQQHSYMSHSDLLDDDKDVGGGDGSDFEDENDEDDAFERPRKRSSTPGGPRQGQQSKRWGETSKKPAPRVLINRPSQAALRGVPPLKPPAMSLVEEDRDHESELQVLKRQEELRKRRLEQKEMRAAIRRQQRDAYHSILRDVLSLAEKRATTTDIFVAGDATAQEPVDEAVVSKAVDETPFVSEIVRKRSRHGGDLLDKLLAAKGNEARGLEMVVERPGREGGVVAGQPRMLYLVHPRATGAAVELVFSEPLPAGWKVDVEGGRVVGTRRETRLGAPTATLWVECEGRVEDLQVWVDDSRVL